MPRTRSLLRSLLVVGVAASVLSLGVGPASAAPVGFTIDDESDQLASIDAGTSVLTDIGGILDDVDAIALACGGTLYGIYTPEEAVLIPAGAELAAVVPSDLLVTIDTATGAVTEIGELGLTRREYGFAIAADGTLWASSGRDLYTVDATTGLATATATLPGELTQMNALAMNAAGTLYGYDEEVGRLFVIDPATGATDEVGNAAAGMGEVVGLDFDSAGTLWAIAQTDGRGVATFDLTTGEGEFTPNPSIAAHGLALTGLCPPPPSTTTTTAPTSTTAGPTTTTTAAPGAAAAAAVRTQPRFAG